MKFTSEHTQIADTVRKFVANEINPFTAEWEKAGIFPARELVQEDGRPRAAGHQVPHRVRRHGAGLQLFHGDGRGAG